MMCKHLSELVHFELGISRGECSKCGEVRFYPEGLVDLYDKKLMQRVRDLNGQNGLQGKCIIKETVSEVSSG